MRKKKERNKNHVVWENVESILSTNLHENYSDCFPSHCILLKSIDACIEYVDYHVVISLGGI